MNKETVVGNCEHCGEDYKLEMVVDGKQIITCPHCQKESDNWDTPEHPQLSPNA